MKSEVESMMWELLDEEAEDSRANPESVTNVAMAAKLAPEKEEKEVEPVTENQNEDLEMLESPLPGQPGVQDTALSFEPPVPLHDMGSVHGEVIAPIEIRDQIANVDAPSILEDAEISHPLPPAPPEMINSQIAISVDVPLSQDVDVESESEIPLVDDRGSHADPSDVPSVSGPNEQPSKMELPPIIELPSVEFPSMTESPLQQVWSEGSFGSQFSFGENTLPDGIDDTESSSIGMEQSSFANAMASRRFRQ